MAKNLALSIIIPCFNESKRLPNRFKTVARDLLNLKKTEIIFVNDGSKDNTLEVLKELSKKYGKIRVISYPENKGKGYAVKKGIAEAKGKIIGFTDADFSYSLNTIPQIQDIVKSGADIVIADRNLNYTNAKRKPGLLRIILGKALSYVNNFLLDLGDISDSQCGFKFFKRSVAKGLFKKITLQKWLFDIELIKNALKKKYKIEKIPVQWEDVGGSKINLAKDIIPVGYDLLKIYLKFFNTKILLAFVTGLSLIILLPFIFNPKSLTLRSGDFSDLVWPSYFFFKDSIYRFHQLPLWNPYIFSGIPEIANPQSPLIYPPNLITLILPINLGLVILILFHVVLGSIFAYLLAKRFLKLSNLSATVFAFAISFSPFLWGKFSVGHLVNGFSMMLLMPVIYFSLDFFIKPKLFKLVVLSLFLSLQYLNHPTHWYYTVLFGALAFVYLGIVQKSFKRSAVILLGAPLSLFLIFPIFLLQFKAGELITRSQLSANDLAIPIWSIKRFITSIAVPSNFLNDNETEVWLYPSIFLTLTAFWGWIKLTGRLKLLSISILGGIVLITLGSRTPFFNFLTQYLPGFSYLRVSTRDWFILSTALAFLAAWGIENIKGKKRNVIAALIFIDLLTFSASRIWFVPDVMKPKVDENITKLLISDQGRYYCTNRCLSASWTMPYGIQTADGYHLLILRNYRDAISEAGGFNPPKYTGNIPTYENIESQPSAEKLGKFAVKWVISKYSLEDKQFKLVKTSGRVMLYENLKYLTRIRFENEVQNKVEILKDSPNEIVIRTSGFGDRLILADSYYPGWEAFIDGKKQEILLEDDWARAVDIPVGEHLVEFKFQPFNNLFKI